MTKISSTVGQLKNTEKVIVDRDEENKRLDLSSDIKGSHYRTRTTMDLDDCEESNTSHIDESSTCDSNGVIEFDYDDDVGDNELIEPLGYQSYLCEINIEYSPGGNLSSSISYEHSFRMKCLPYMVEQNKTDMSSRGTLLDVCRETSAFLGNSDYVPNQNLSTKRVVVELVSAKLSSSNSYTIPPNSSFTNLVSQEGDGPSHLSTSAYSDVSSLRSFNGNPSAQINNPSMRNQRHSPVPLSSRNSSPKHTSTPKSSAASSSSKRFVNYTIVIKTIPGLDRCPIVIERRFSDFLRLYEGLKDDETLAPLIDKSINFPRKVYMGNFSLEKIAQRSIEFNRLLHLCMSEYSLLWSPPFVSFLIDKELKEAHRLSLYGDPDDAQAMFETVNSIKQKLYAGCEY